MDEPPPSPHRRRKRYSGAHPKRFQDKYKELAGDAATLEKVAASGKTPAGTHRPIMVDEICRALRLRPGASVVDATLGYGGHALELLRRIQPGGKLVGLDQDPAQLPLTVSRLRELGWDEEKFTAHRANFAGLPAVLGAAGWEGADGILADLGVSSMQIDNPTRGFSYKQDGPLDMRMNPSKGQPAWQFLAKISPEKLALTLEVNADEPNAALLAPALAGRTFASTRELARAIASLLPADKAEAALPRVFQALRIAVNDEFGALESLLRALPHCLKRGATAVLLTFHSGEDRRVKKAFAEGLHEGIYAQISPSPLLPSPAEQRANPRSSSAKLRWARLA